MLDKDQTAAAAKTLHDHWQAGTKIGDLDLSQRPRDRAEGYAIQAAMQRYGSPFGWKIAATSEAGQKHINVAGPQAGRIFAERVIADGGTASMAGNEMRVGEPEFAFRMGRSLPPRPTPYSVEDVLARRRYAASGDRTAGLALCRFRQGRRSATDRRQCLRAFVCARRADAPRTGVRSTSSRRGRWSRCAASALSATAGNVLGDPRVALTWLANELRQLGVTLKAGEVVTTGTCHPPLPIESGRSVRSRLRRVRQEFPSRSPEPSSRLR